MRAHRRRLTLGDAAAEIKHQDVVTDRHHHAHIVFDQQDRHALGVDRAYHLGHAPGFGLRQPGGGFVEQQHFGRRCKGARDLDNLQITE